MKSPDTARCGRKDQPERKIIAVHQCDTLHSALLANCVLHHHQKNFPDADIPAAINRNIIQAIAKGSNDAVHLFYPNLVRSSVVGSRVVGSRDVRKGRQLVATSQMKGRQLVATSHPHSLTIIRLLKTT